ncbi:ATP-binding protein [uncultured Pseudokineococcus sp.]|uniref:ATP-binding protein n=1 Tax=uncultured Pseudokineococcus sp. TaxID=1642928 RepID=UPI00260E7046|nr:ATP-binding protein [uncultured Pseudokineococcus sp.]
MPSDLASDTADAALRAIERGARACDLEGQRLDFKEYKRPGPTDRDPLKAGAVDLAEAVACLANARGGSVVVGVADTARGAGAFVGLPTGLDADDLRHRIWEVTRPNLVVTARRREVAGRHLLILEVEPGFDLYRVGGKLRERIGTNCLPMDAEREARVLEERRNYDWSAEPADQDADSISETAVEEARRLLTQAGDEQSRRRATLSKADLLRECGVVDEDGHLLRAGELLFGAGRAAPNPSLQYLRKKTPGGPLTRPPDGHGAPLLIALSECLRDVDAVNETTPVTLPSGVQQQLETIPRTAVREALVNAVAHRDYRLPDAVVLEHSAGQLVVTSPGDLVFGVTEDNLLTHTSKPRNRTLASALRVLRLAEQAGTGVDTMVRAMVQAGHRPPVFASGGGSVRVVLNGGAPVTRVAALVAGLPADVRDDTDAALVIDHLRTHATVDAANIATALQKSDEEAAEVLKRLSDDRYDLLEPTRESRRSRRPAYRFRERVRAELGTLLPYHRNEQDAVDRRIVEHLREYDTVSNKTVQNLCQVQVARASALLRSLADRQVIQKTADSPERGPTVRYERGPRYPKARTRRRASGTATVGPSNPDEGQATLDL